MHLVLRHHTRIPDIPDDEADARATMAREIAAVATREPEAGAWGIAFGSDDAAVYGGDTGTLLWLGTRAALVDFIERWLVYLPPRPMEENLAAAAASAAKVARSMRAGTLTDDEAGSALDRDLGRFLTVEWIGTFESLCGGRHDYAVRARAGFRGHQKAAERTAAGDSDGWAYAYDVDRELGEPATSPEELGVFRAGLAGHPAFVVDEFF